jgi:hypothetical protein
MLNKKALAASVSAPPAPFVEDVFSTYLYTGNGTTQAIANGIDLAGKGGLIWIKGRAIAYTHQLHDTVRGVGNTIASNNTDAQSNQGTVSAVSSTGFTASTNSGSFSGTNNNGDTYCSWTFAEQAKFFDVVTYTGTGSARTVAHNLGSAPGMIIVKRTDSIEDWFVYHRGITASGGIKLNNSDAKNDPNNSYWNSTEPTSTVFTVGTNGGVNGSGGTYVAYLFAHDAGGFGTAGTDNVISCGSYTGNGSTQSISLGYEPQYILFKNTTDAASWYVVDVMRGLPTGGDDQLLIPNLSAAELTVGDVINVNATGFDVTTSSVANTSGKTYIYMAIRRPMKVPTTGTSVFNPTKSNAANGTPITTNFVVDSQWINYLPGTTTNTAFNDRLRGVSTNATESGRYVRSASNAAEATALTYTNNWGNTGYLIPSATAFDNTVYYSFSRRPGFFDTVCYTGTGSVGNAISHNLTVAPELIIVKGRSGLVGANNWRVLNSFTSTTYQTAYLDLTDANTSFAYTDNGGLAARPTATTFTVDNVANYNNSSTNYVAYLFATCAGVSKVGSYTGTAAAQTINCGFTGGARFVLIKRTDSTGDWYVWDTARGIISGNDPYLLLNSTAAEVTNTDYIDPASSGFEISSTAPAAINASGGTFIFLAVS